MAKYESEKKAAARAEKKRLQKARVEKKRADREKRIQDKKDAEERRLREIKEAEEAEMLAKESREGWHFYLERGGKHFPSLVHKQKVFAGGRDKAQFYERLAEKLGIENNFVLHMQDPKTYEWSEFEHMFTETTGPENERRGRLVRDEDNWFPDAVNDETKCCLCGDKIGKSRRRYHPGLRSHKQVPRGVHTFEMAAGPFHGGLAPMCNDHYEHLQWHLSKFHPDTRKQICGPCWMWNELQENRVTFGAIDSAQTQIDPWGANPRFYDDRDMWHHNLDPAEYRFRNVRSEWDVRKQAEREKRAVDIKEWNKKERQKERARQKMERAKRDQMKRALTQPSATSASSEVPGLQLVSVDSKSGASGGGGGSGGSSSSTFVAHKTAMTLALMGEDHTGDFDKEALRDKVEDAFDSFDTDGTGQIDVHELGALTAALDYPMHGEELSQLMAWLDKSGDGLVSLEEFMDYWMAF